MVHMNRLNFCQNCKNLSLGALLEIFGTSWPGGFTTSFTLWLSEIMNKIRKCWWAISEILCSEGTNKWKEGRTDTQTDRQTDRHTDEQIQIHKKLPITRVSNKSNVFIFMINLIIPVNIINYVSYIWENI